LERARERKERLTKKMGDTPSAASRKRGSPLSENQTENILKNSGNLNREGNLSSFFFKIQLIIFIAKLMSHM
jgi:hypothetical protein